MKNNLIKIELKIQIFVFFLLFSSYYSFSQCTCIGGASVGGFTPVGGTTNIGILREDNFRVVSFYTFSNGNEYFNNDIPIEQGVVKSFESSFMGILLGYGVLEDLTIDSEFGYYLNKSQEFDTYTLSGNGFSHFAIYAKYNAFSSRIKEFEWTFGIGGRIPLISEEQNLPQNIQSSSGAYGSVLLSYLHKGFKSAGLHFLLVNRVETNAENSTTYKYGTNFINSLFVGKQIVEKLNLFLEVKNNLKLNDSKYDNEIADSGWNIIFISPQINYSIYSFNVSAFFDYPMYKYYNGNQLTHNNSFGFSVTWQADLY